MSLDAYITRLPDDEPIGRPCDECGRPRVNQADPAACQCPDDEAPECASCHEDGAAEGSEYCHGCLEVSRESLRCAERAAQNADARGATSQAAAIREYIRSAA